MHTQAYRLTKHALYQWGHFVMLHPIVLAAWIAAVASVISGAVIVALMASGHFERGVSDPARGVEDRNGIMATRGT